MHWFRHLQLAVVGSLAVVSLVDRLGYDDQSGYRTVRKHHAALDSPSCASILRLYLVATLYFRPYAKRAWKLPVKVALLVALIVLSVCASHTPVRIRGRPELQRRAAEQVGVDCINGRLRHPRRYIFYCIPFTSLLRGAQKEHFKRLSFRKVSEMR